MGRRAEGPKYRLEGATWYVRFTAHGRRVEYATGETDRGLAERWGARRYAEALAAGPSPAPVRVVQGGALAPIMGEWLAALEATHDPETVAHYKWMAKRKFLPRFTRLDAITPRELAAYRDERLRKVSRETVYKELSILHGFLAWCKQTDRLAECPGLPTISQRSTGVRAGRQREAPVELSPEDVEAILAALPERSPRDGFVLLDYYIVAYETGLRPATLDALEAPRHWRPGEAVLRLTADIDKARYGREVDITPRAVAALERAMGGRENGLVFGRSWRWRHLKAAARLALGARGEDVAPYDLRHGRITHLLERTGNLTGVAYIAGHRQVTTTNRYARPTRRAGAAALRGSFSGDGGRYADAEAEKTPEASRLPEKSVGNSEAPKGQVSRVERGQGVPAKAAVGRHSGGVPRLDAALRWLDGTLATLQRDWTVASHLDRAVAAALRRDEAGCLGAMHAVREALGR